MKILLVFKRSIERNGSLNIIVKAVTTVESVEHFKILKYLLVNNITQNFKIIHFTLEPDFGYLNSEIDREFNGDNDLKDILNKGFEGMYDNRVYPGGDFIEKISIHSFILEYINTPQNSLLFKLFKSNKKDEKDYLLIFDQMDWVFIVFLFSIVDVTLSGGHPKYRHKTSILDKKLIDFLTIITQRDNKKVEHILINNLIKPENISPYFSDADIKRLDEKEQIRQEYIDKGKLYLFGDFLDQNKDNTYYRGKLLKKGVDVLLEKNKAIKNNLLNWYNSWKGIYDENVFYLILKALDILNKVVSYRNKDIQKDITTNKNELEKISKIALKLNDKQRTQDIEENSKIAIKIEKNILKNEVILAKYDDFDKFWGLKEDIKKEIIKMKKDDKDINKKYFIITILLIIYLLFLKRLEKIPKKNILLHSEVEQKKILKNKKISLNIKKENKKTIRLRKKLKNNLKHLTSKNISKVPLLGSKNVGISSGSVKKSGFRNYGTFILPFHPLNLKINKNTYSSFSTTNRGELDENNNLKPSEKKYNNNVSGSVQIYREKISINYNDLELKSKKNLYLSDLKDSGLFDLEDPEDKNKDYEKYSIFKYISFLINNKLKLDIEDGSDTSYEEVCEGVDIDESITYDKSFNSVDRNYTRYNVQYAIEEYWIESIKSGLLKINEEGGDPINIKKNLNKILSDSSETVRLLYEKKNFLKYKKIFNDLDKIDYLIIALTIIINYHKKKPCTDIDNYIGKSISYNSYNNELKKFRKIAYKELKKGAPEDYSSEKILLSKNNLYLGSGTYFISYEEFVKRNKLTSEDFKILGHLFVISFEISNIIIKDIIDSKAYLRFDDKFYKILVENLFIIPTQLPMICKPRPHGDNQYGGFLSNTINMNGVITGSIEYECHNISEKTNLYTAINKINSIKFEINKDLLNYINEHGDYLIKNLVGLDSMHVRYTLKIAETYKNRFFYLPVHADWRGRIYVQSFFITYQGNELSSALVQFHEGCKLNDTGLDYFYVYGANLYNEFNISKKPYDIRKKWTIDNSDNILKMDKEWIEKADQKLKFVAYCLAFKKYKEKKGTDDEYEIKIPLFLDATCNGLQHLAALIKDYDLGRRLNLVKQKESDCVSDIYSAVLDPINKKLNESIDLNNNEIKKKINMNPNLLQVKELKLERKNIKPLIMTKPYNATIDGMSHQLIDTVKDTKHFLDVSKTPYYIFSGVKGQVILNRSSIFYVANIIHKEVFILFPELKKVFDFLIKMAEICVRSGVPLYWFTPQGVKIQQHYIKHYTKKISFKLGKRSESMVIADPLKEKHLQRRGDDKSVNIETDLLKQKQGIVPNVIHSLDAAHLASIILKNNINIIGIHDCFGTLPNNLATLERSIKEEFINIYSKEDFLKTFHSRILQSLRDHNITIYEKTIKNVTQTRIKFSSKKNVVVKDKNGDLIVKNKMSLQLPDPPESGNLDITQIINSRYMVN